MCRSYSRPLSKQMEDIPLAEGGGGTGRGNGRRAGDLDSIFEKMGTGRVRHEKCCACQVGDCHVCMHRMYDSF